MFYLLDINVLIASADPGHQFHDAFKRWYIDRKKPALATCPLTENGFLRIYGHPDYPGGPGSPAMALTPLTAIRNRPDSVFLADDVSLADPANRNLIKNATSKQLTDIYLLSLAARHQGIFASFDRGIRTDRVEQGNRAFELLTP
ncbi:MAG: TA system VapC family ribonuclease toxin [Kiritimatiellia bacterium]